MRRGGGRRSARVPNGRDGERAVAQTLIAMVRRLGSATAASDHGQH